MQLRENTLEQFAGVLASDAPAPGGGSVAALNGALAAALLRMVGALTVGKEKYKEFRAEVQEMMDGASALQSRLLAGVDEDTEAFNKVSAVFSMPKGTDEEKTARSAAMQAALKGAALAPLATMKAAHGCLKLAAAAHGKVNASCASDLGSAALCALASARAAWLNVKINLSGIKDAEFNESTGREAREILAESEKIADELYAKIEQEV